MTTPNPVPTLTPGTCPAGFDYCCSGLTGCGIRYNIPLTPTTTPGPGQARYGSQPWQALIFATDNTYIGGGAIFDTANIITAAHKVAGRAASSIKVRLGEWNASSTGEPYPVVESAVSSITIHPAYNPNNLFNDIAILRLATPVTYSPSINNICIPPPNTVFDGNR